MPFIRRIAPLLSIAVLAAPAMPARADYKIVEVVSTHNPQLDEALKSASPQQRQSLAAMGMGADLNVTLYASGSRLRTDRGSTSSYMDSATHKVIVVNRALKTETTIPFNPEMIALMASNANIKVVDTGRTSVILGHMAHLYKLSLSMASQRMNINGETWAAADIPAATSTGSDMMGSLMAVVLKKVKGMPLKSTITMSGGPMGSTTILVSVKSISKAPLPASIFAIPTGYTATAMPAFGGMHQPGSP